MQALPASDDCPHRHDGQESWQESSLFVWHDREAGLGGFWRLGHEPVRQALNSSFGVFTDEGLRFRSNVSGAPLSAADRGDSHMGWGSKLRVDFGHDARIKVDFPDCEADLRFEDFFDRFDYTTLATPGHARSGAAHHHFEVAGRMQGQVRIGDRVVEIDALGYRDRSWGHRGWDELVSTRWWPCVFGPDLTVHLVHVAFRNGLLQKAGFVWRDGRAIAVIDSDMIVGLESDALTPRFAEARITLETGEELLLRGDRRDGHVLHVRGYTAVETIGIATLEGRQGFSNIEVSTNPAAGSAPPVVTMGSNMGEGLTRR